MPVLKLFIGKKGQDGIDGIDGLGSADVNGFDLEQPLLDCFHDNQLSKNAFIEFTRQDPASFVDRYGRNTWTKKDQTTNYIIYSENFSQWADTFGRWSIIGSTTDPFSGSDATEINLDVDTDDLSGNGEVVELTVTTPAINGCVSFYIKLISGDVSSLDFVIGNTTTIVEDVTSQYKRIIFPIYLTGTFIFSINPRGKAGARVAIYGVQIEDNPTDTALINTTGTTRTITNTSELIRQNEKGILIESKKTNLAHYGNDLSKWTVLNGTVAQSLTPDAFFHINQYTSVVFGSLANIEITTTTDSLTQGNSYTVSFWAYITEGSLQPIIISLGGGVDVTFSAPSVVGFTRLSAICIAGPDNDLTIKLESQALNAKLLISSVQVEIDDLTTYKQTGAAGTTRNPSNFNFDYEYNFPAPNLEWSFIFSKRELANDSNIKTIFSNGLSGVSEFSMYYQNSLLFVNMGGNTVSEILYEKEQVAITYDGTSIRFYASKALVSTKPLASSSTMGSKVYIGHNGTDEHLNAYLSGVIAYNKELSLNEIIYLTVT